METTGELDSSRRLVEFISSSVKGDCYFYRCPEARIVDSSFTLHISGTIGQKWLQYKGLSPTPLAIKKIIIIIHYT
jgi:hypothetical protein